MEYFLEYVAKDIYGKFGNDLANVAIVFPNKRAGIFFDEYLASQTDKPVWAPAYVSISELFQRLSSLKLGDPILLNCELYRIFKEELKNDETFDEFFSWGEILISDFDDLDKNFVDPEKLFSNLQDLKNMSDDLNFLDKDQEEAIQQFFKNFSIEQRSVLKEKFISVWDKLGSIYNRYRQRLRELGIAYEGMLYRDAINAIEAETPESKRTLQFKHYVFVGFNALSKVEHSFFSLMQKSEKALFYWDYDIFYTHRMNHEAGTFILKNLNDFPNSLSEEYFDCLGKPKKVCFISSPTENAQARFVSQWVNTLVNDNAGETLGRDNAVVLCNEELMLPVLHSIPSEVKDLNITMGFPLSQTPVYSFISALIDLQTNGYNKENGLFRYAEVQAVLAHNYTRRLSANAERLECELTKKCHFFPAPSELKQDDFLSFLFTPQSGIIAYCNYLAEVLKKVATLYRDNTDSHNSFESLYQESLFKSYTLVNRLFNLFTTQNLSLNDSTFRRLLNRILAGASIPFHGEPAIGMQVMGVLETRNLDFKNLLMLSVNEGLLPKTERDVSFIPYNLRKAFGMTTIEHKDAVYAYYFYRLISRAENITLLYNNVTEGKDKKERSRYLLQFLLDWPHPIKLQALIAGQSPNIISTFTIEKTDEIVERLRKKFDRSINKDAAIISPSALNKYLKCPMMFYFKYVAGLTVPDEISGEIDSALFGTIFHRCAELAYKKLTANGARVEKEDIERMLKDEAGLNRIVSRAFNEKLFIVGNEDTPIYNGIQLINYNVILSFLKKLLRIDANYAPFSIIDMEKPVEEEMTINTDSGKLTIKLGGTIDRLDEKEGIIRIIDYKTGTKPQTFSSTEQLFIPKPDRPDYIFQTFLYAAIVSHNTHQSVAPALLFIQKAGDKDYSPIVEHKVPRALSEQVTNFSDYDSAFREQLAFLLQEIFNKEQPFTQTDNLKTCLTCDFKKLCGK